MISDKYLFVINATAGRGKTGKKIAHIIDSLNSHKMDYEIVLTKAPQHAVQIAQDAAANSLKNIIAVGGDGTLNEVLNGIMRSGKSEDVILGLIPEGGGNDFANNFDLTQKVDRAIEIILQGNTTGIDIGKVENYYFINALGIGFDAKVAYISKGIKYLNGLPRYLSAIIKALISHHGYNAEITADDHSFEKQFLLMSVGNGKTTGGGFYLTPNAEIDDGFFDICFIENVVRSRILKLLPSAIKGKHLQEREVCIKQAENIKVRSPKLLPIYCDGEIPQLENPKEFSIEIIANAINFIC